MERRRRAATTMMVTGIDIAHGRVGKRQSSTARILISAVTCCSLLATASGFHAAGTHTMVISLRQSASIRSCGGSTRPGKVLFPCQGSEVASRRGRIARSGVSGIVADEQAVKLLQAKATRAALQATRVRKLAEEKKNEANALAKEADDAYAAAAKLQADADAASLALKEKLSAPAPCNPPPAAAAEAANPSAGDKPASKASRVFVFDLEGTLLDAMPDLGGALPPYTTGPEFGQCIDDNFNEITLSPSALSALRSLAGTPHRACVIGRSGCVEEILSAIQISEGFFASDVIEFVEVTSGVSRGLRMSETMRSVMVTSSVKALSRRLPKGSGDLVYIGRERRVCSDVAKLGVESLRAPYGLDDEVWGKAMAM